MQTLVFSMPFLYTARGLWDTKETYGRDASKERRWRVMTTYETVQVVIGLAGLLIAYTAFVVKLLKKK